MKFRNINSGVVNEVCNLKMRDGRIFFQVRGKGCGAKFFNRNTCLVLDEHVSDGTFLKVADGWELAEEPKKARAPRKAKVAEPTSAPEPAPTTTTEPTAEPKLTRKPAKTGVDAWKEYKDKHPQSIILMRLGDFYETYNEDAEAVATICGVTLTKRVGSRLCGFPFHAIDTYLPKLIRAGKRVAICEGGGVKSVADPKSPVVNGYVIDLQAGMTVEQCRKELSAKYGSMGEDILNAAIKIAAATMPKPEPTTASVNKEDVVSIVEEWAKHNRMNLVQKIEVVSPRGVANLDGTFVKHFSKLQNIVNAGTPLYMYGPAGSGKSYTAKQIADALKLDYYETSQAQFAYELKGYADYKGQFVETAFYKAYANGGVFFLDEVDASAPEAVVVLNNAIANGNFDFPAIGNVKAHKDFRVIAAGNTRMTGATLAYVARQMQDTSFKNRFFFDLFGYDTDIFLQMAGGDKEIVDFGADLRKAARETGIHQLFSYRQAKELAMLQEACEGDDVYLLRGAVMQEKEVDDLRNLYEHLSNKQNRWAKALYKLIDVVRNEEVW